MTSVNGDEGMKQAIQKLFKNESFIAVLLIFFSIMEVAPFFKNVQMGKDKLIIGGILSGFFGGLSGHQGALRSAFLIKSNLGKEAFIATGIVIACMVDLSRLGVYIPRFSDIGSNDNIVLVIAATASAFFTNNAAT